MAKSSKAGGILFTLVVAGAVSYGGWYYYKSRIPKDPIYTTAMVTNATIKQTVTATGDLTMRTQINVGSLVSGKVLEVRKDFNDTVKAGELLVLIDDVTFKQKVEQARISLENTQTSSANSIKDADRTLELYKQGLATEQDRDSAEAKKISARNSIKTSEIALENAKTDLDRCSVTSPIDGVVMSRIVEQGSSVNASQNVASLFVIVSSYKEMKIEALVSEADIGLVKEGFPVEFTVDAFPIRVFQASVKQVRNSSKNSSGVVSYPVIIFVDNNDEALKPGMSASVAVVIANRQNVLAVPNGALRTRIPTDYKGEVRKASGTAAATAPAGAPGQSTAPDVQLPGAAGQGFAGGPGGPGGGRGQAGGAAGGGRGGAGGAGGGRGGGRGGNQLGNIGEGVNVTNTMRTVYRYIEDPVTKKVAYIEELSVRIGIADTQNTELAQGSSLNPGDKLVTFITMPSATPILTSAPANAQNAFGNQGGRGGQIPGGAGGAGGARGGGGGGGGGRG